MSYGAAFEDAFNLLCGEQIGRGAHRTVFACRIRPDLVVKVENDDTWRSFMNVFEAHFHADNERNPKVARWLAPVEYLSPDGRILLQRRAKPVDKSDLPELVPAFLTDLKPENFGWLDGRIICVDYALNIKNPPTRMKKADW